MNINEFTTPQLRSHATFWRRMIEDYPDDPIMTPQAESRLKEFENLIAQRSTQEILAPLNNCRVADGTRPDTSDEY